MLYETTNKFIILGNARSGTTLLNEALAKHKSIRVTYEALHENAQEGAVSWRDNFDIPFAKNEEFLNALFKKFDGFKILYHQLNYDHLLWKYFEKNNIKKIHIIRKNLAEIAISLILCKKSNIWQKTKKDKELNETLLIEPAKLKADIIGIENYINLYLKFLPCDLIVYYEEMINDWDNTTGEICDLLKITRIQLPKTLFKRTQPLNSVLTNFDEHKEYFKNTPYEHFFE